MGARRLAARADSFSEMEAELGLPRLPPDPYMKQWMGMPDLSAEHTGQQWLFEEEGDE